MSNTLVGGRAWTGVAALTSTITIADSHAPLISYAFVYPLTMLFGITGAQALIVAVAGEFFSPCRSSGANQKGESG